MINILYVEDDLIAGKIGMSTLALFANVKATLVTTGYDAIETFSQQKFDLIIIDLGLPDISGTEAVTLLNKQFEDVPPVVAVTAHIDTKQAPPVPPQGVSRVYAKPLTFELAKEILSMYACLLYTSPSPRD